MSNTVETNTVIPTVETIVAKPSRKVKTQAKEGNGGKGNILKDASKAQARKAFESDSHALASVLVALGALENTQQGKNGVIARRIYGDLPTLEAARNRLSANDKKIAGAAIEAIRATAVLRGKFFSIELFRNSVAIRSRMDAGKHHKQAK